jgi:hypothetical protein
LETKGLQSDTRTEMGRNLARMLFDYKLKDLRNLNATQTADLRAKFPKLSNVEFDDVLKQVIEARTYQQERIGWQTVPHDIAVLLFVAITCLIDLRWGIVVGIGALVLSESVFQFYFQQRLYRVLSTLVWLTYPGYALLAYILYLRGYAYQWILLIVVLVWGGSFLLGMVARLPVRLYMQARSQGVQDAINLRQKRPDIEKTMRERQARQKTSSNESQKKAKDR